LATELDIISPSVHTSTVADSRTMLVMNPVSARPAPMSRLPMARTYSGRYRETTPVVGSSSTSTSRPLSPMSRPKSRALRPTSLTCRGRPTVDWM
jgi:hypothetical protein